MACWNWFCVFHLILYPFLRIWCVYCKVIVSVFPSEGTQQDICCHTHTGVLAIHAFLVMCCCFCYSIVVCRQTPVTSPEECSRFIIAEIQQIPINKFEVFSQTWKCSKFSVHVSWPHWRIIVPDPVNTDRDFTTYKSFLSDSMIPWPDKINSNRMMIRCVQQPSLDMPFMVSRWNAKVVYLTPFLVIMVGCHIWCHMKIVGVGVGVGDGRVDVQHVCKLTWICLVFRLL